MIVSWPITDRSVVKTLQSWITFEALYKINKSQNIKVARQILNVSVSFFLNNCNHNFI